MLPLSTHHSLLAAAADDPECLMGIWLKNKTDLGIKQAWSILSFSSMPSEV